MGCFQSKSVTDSLGELRSRITILKAQRLGFIWDQEAQIEEARRAQDEATRRLYVRMSLRYAEAARRCLAMQQQLETIVLRVQAALDNRETLHSLRVGSATLKSLRIEEDVAKVLQQWREEEADGDMWLQDITIEEADIDAALPSVPTHRCWEKEAPPPIKTKEAVLI